MAQMMVHRNTLRPLHSYSKSSACSHQSFLAAANQEKAIQKCIEEHIAPVINKEVRELLEYHSSKEAPFRILGVGSGEGENDIHLLEAFSKIRRKPNTAVSVVNRVVEPDIARLSTFRTKAANLSKRFKKEVNVAFEWVPMTFQEYSSQKKAEDAKFDVVHFIHSIYYLGVEDALVHCYEKELGDKGIIMTITQAEDDPMMKFASQFPDQRHRSFPRNKDVVAVAKQKGWKYFACSGDSNELDITNIFDSSSRQGNHLLNFLTNRRELRQNEKKETVEKILKFWEEHSFVNAQGRRIVQLRDNAVIILK